MNTSRVLGSYQQEKEVGWSAIHGVKFDSPTASTKGQDQFMPLFSGDLHWDYDFTVRYTALEPALGKQFRVQQLLQWASIWAQNPALKADQLMRATLELLDFHESDRYVRSEQELMQIQQAQQAQQMQMMAANAQLQDEMAAKNDERDLVKSIATQLVKG